MSPEQLEVDPPELVVIGGGRLHLDRAQGTLEVRDDSHIYGRFDDDTLGEQIAAAEKPWCDLALRAFLMIVGTSNMP